VPKGAYAPDIIVLLTDGVSNAGPAPVDAAQQAADRGVRVYTIGFGTASGAGNPFCSQQLQGGGSLDNSGAFGGGFGGGGFGGGGFGGFRRGIDEDTLKQVADMTGGTYYSAESAGELQDVFQNLPTYLITKHETTEISVAFAALGALLAAIAIGLSLIWHPLP
jgi:Ca-activated chloride channel family protein